MSGMRTARETIGYWLKQADAAITERSDQALSIEGFTRTHWQTLNLIFEAGAVSRQDIFATMRTFITDSQLDEILGLFARSGWLVEQYAGEERMLELTEAGKQTHERVFARQREVRQRAMQGISGEEYAAAISVLQRIVQNLEERSMSSQDIPQQS
jgi:DNA-binding MarR family transcriptional regulator